MLQHEPTKMAITTVGLPSGQVRWGKGLTTNGEASEVGLGESRGARRAGNRKGGEGMQSRVSPPQLKNATPGFADLT